MSVYEILIRRFNLLRFLFGMKTKDYSKTWQMVLYVTSGIFFVLVAALIVVSSTSKEMSPPPTKPGLYVIEEFGFQLNFRQV